MFSQFESDHDILLKENPVKKIEKTKEIKTAGYSLKKRFIKKLIKLILLNEYSVSIERLKTKPLNKKKKNTGEIPDREFIYPLLNGIP